MGHMNVRFYVARAMEGLVGLAAALGLVGAFRPGASATLRMVDQHIRFLREARARAPLHMTAGIVALGESDLHVLQLLIHSFTGEIAAVFQARLAHVTAGDGRSFPWSDRTRARAEGLMAEVPAALAPRSLSFAPATSSASLARAEALGLIRLGAGAIGPEDADTFGCMRAEVFIGRVSDNVPRLAEAMKGTAIADAPGRPANVGGAVVENRLLYLGRPRIGDRFEIRSGLAGADTRTRRIVHWMLDPETGEPWGAAEAVAVSFDLETRRLLPTDEADLAKVRARVVEGLRL